MDAGGEVAHGEHEADECDLTLVSYGAGLARAGPVFMSRLLDFDPLTGIRTTFDYDHASDTTIIAYDDPFGVTEKTLEWNKKRKANISKSVCQEKRDLIHYARIPPMAQLDMYSRYGVRVWDPEHTKKVLRLVNSNEYADCKIGRLIHA